MKRKRGPSRSEMLRLLVENRALRAALKAAVPMAANQATLLLTVGAGLDRERGLILDELGPEFDIAIEPVFLDVTRLLLQGFGARQSIRSLL